MTQKNIRAANGMRREPKYVKRRQRGLAVLIAALVLIIGGIIYIGVQVSGDDSNQTTANDYEGTGNGEAELVEIPEGSSVSQLGPELEERDIVRSDAAFQTAASANPNAASVQPGFYRLQGQMSAAAAVEALLDPTNRTDMLDIHGGATLMDVTVIGGDTRPGIYSQISGLTCNGNEEDCIPVEELERVAATTAPEQLGVPEWAIDAVNSRGEDPKRLEGLIAPGQYVINPQHDATEILTDLVSRSADT